MISSDIWHKYPQVIFQNCYGKWNLIQFWNITSGIYKQLLDEFFVISGIIKVEVSVISRNRRLRLITLTETLIIPDITKTESNNCFIIPYFEENNDKRIIAVITVYFQTLLSVHLTLLLEIMHYTCNLQIIH